jgi:hypothetical protein
MNSRGQLSVDVILILLGYAVGTVAFAYKEFTPRSESEDDRALIRSDITEIKNDIKQILQRLPARE